MIRPGGMREAIRRPWLARGHGVLDHPPSFSPPILEVLPDLAVLIPLQKVPHRPAHSAVLVPYFHLPLLSPLFLEIS